MYKIAVFGERDSIYGFASVGLDIFPVEDLTRAGRQLKGLVESGYAIIYVTESMFPHIKAEIDLYRDQPLPAIIAIPGVEGVSGKGLAEVRRSVEQAVGSDILFGGDK